MTQDARITAAEATGIVEQKLKSNELGLLERCYQDIKQTAHQGHTATLVKYHNHTEEEFGPSVARELRKDGFVVECPPFNSDMVERELLISWPKVEYPFPEKG